MKNTLLECVRSAGVILMKHFGGTLDVSIKHDHCNVVTQADLASEACIIEKITAKFPAHNIIAEETGFLNKSSDITWIVDPLDGTSNFAAGIPWFGVMIAVLKDTVPIMAAMYLPVDDVLYFCEKDKGVFRDDRKVSVTSETKPENVLCSCAMDACRSESQTRQRVELLTKLLHKTRNIRATNSLVDFCCTIDGRLGACINHSTKIWDIAPSILMFPEAGGIITDIHGREINLSIDEKSCDREYGVVGASRILHPQIIEIVSAQ